MFCSILSVKAGNKNIMMATLSSEERGNRHDVSTFKLKK